MGSGVRLFHFSEDASIAEFRPRPVRVPAERGPGREWLNGALVWAVAADRAPLYLFPRECPRILLWPKPDSDPAEVADWWAGSRARMLAYMETGWLERFGACRLWRYEFLPDGFEDLEEAGYWVSRETVVPIDRRPVGDLAMAIAEENVELRVLPDLLALRDVWSTSLHASGVRLRNALGWGEPGWPHTSAKG